jgi:hypothetical protein
MVSIRSEHMPAIAAMHRAVSHIGQHVGQIVLLAKHYRSSSWNTLSIPRRGSAEANRQSSSGSASHR